MVLFMLFTASVSFAQRQKEPRFAPRINFSMNKYGDDLVGPRYQQMIRQIIDGDRARFNFELFRIYYSSSVLYDPRGGPAKEELLQYAYGMVEAGSAAAKEMAERNYRAHLYAHMGNIEVIAQALSLSLQDEMYGDPEMFNWLMNGLIKSVLRSGDGNSLSSPYVVLTLAEEKYVIDHKKVKVLESEEATRADRILNVHKVVGGDSPEPYFMVFDISKPMNYIDFTESQTPEALGNIRKR